MNNNNNVFVLGLDGTPYSLLEEPFIQGIMPNLSDLFNRNAKRMNSVYPTVSSVAWTSYMTGLDPSGHNIFGFIDRIPNPFSMKIPTALDRKGESLWATLSKQGKRVISINVPLTYPPEEVNGILVSGFLCPDINKVSYPVNFSTFLKDKGYIIDVDAWLARKSRHEFMDKLHQALDKRFEITFDLMNKESWDFFQLHIMETDRLFHFFWQDLEAKGEFHSKIIDFFKKLDGHIGRLEARLEDKDKLLILSDHGFCSIKAEVQLNVWLKNEGLLKIPAFSAGLSAKPRAGSENGGAKLQNYQKDSICYSLLPGRIFINLKGREEKGSVEESDYDSVRQDIKNRLLNLKDPQNNENIIDKVFFREEIYSGPFLNEAADIIAHPAKGYDLKGKLDTDRVFDSSAINGMHTFDDAFICARNIDISSIVSIQDVRGVILSAFSENRHQTTEDRTK